jgi:ribosomal protein S12 methylthiotransferase
MMSAMAPSRGHGSGVLRIHLASLGCAKNLVDSERLLARLATAGALVGAPAEEADVVLVNTCGFIDPARRESLAVIADYVALKAERPDLKLFVLGCLVVRDGEALRRDLPAVDGFFGIDEHDAIARACGLAGEETGDTRLLLTPSHTAYLRIADGCDNRCSYCTIPSIRGAFRSRPADEILAEARSLAALGVRELNLIGQDTTAYGKDIPGGPGIVGLLERLDAIDGVRWVRLLYAHPARLGDDLIRAYARLEKLVPYVDLPLQHASDRILSAMGRRVDRGAIGSLLSRLREAVPEIALRTTFIVGFPGETDAEFAELIAFIEETRFDHVGAFAYSPEPGTAAAEMPSRVPPDVVAERLERLLAAQTVIVLETNRTRVGDVVDVLIDGSDGTPGVTIGRTATQAPDVDPVTRVRGRQEQGTFVRARITGHSDLDLTATVVR